MFKKNKSTRHSFSLGFPDGSVGKESACNEGNLGSNPGSGRSPGEGNGKPLQCPCLKNPTDGKEPSRLQSLGSQRVWGEIAEVRQHSTAAQSLEVNYPTYHIKHELKFLDKREKDLITESQSSLSKFERGKFTNY